MIFAYSYNDAQPRFYSKYNYAEKSSLYDISFTNATQAAISTNGYFEPKVFTNAGGEKEALIDGSVVSENLAMYSYMHAKDKL